jgi:hypothetical protein
MFCIQTIAAKNCAKMKWGLEKKIFGKHNLCSTKCGKMMLFLGEK